MNTATGPASSPRRSRRGTQRAAVLLACVLLTVAVLACGPERHRQITATAGPSAAAAAAPTAPVPTSGHAHPGQASAHAPCPGAVLVAAATCGADAARVWAAPPLAAGLPDTLAGGAHRMRGPPPRTRMQAAPAYGRALLQQLCITRR